MAAQLTLACVVFRYDIRKTYDTISHSKNFVQPIKLYFFYVVTIIREVAQVFHRPTTWSNRIMKSMLHFFSSHHSGRLGQIKGGELTKRLSDRDGED